MMEAIRSSKTSVLTTATCLHIPEDGILLYNTNWLTNYLQQPRKKLHEADYFFEVYWSIRILKLKDVSTCQRYHNYQSVAASKDATEYSAQHASKLEHLVHDASSISQRKLMTLQAGMHNSTISIWQRTTYWGIPFAAIGVQEWSSLRPW
jgi:hypothetical protein